MSCCETCRYYNPYRPYVCKLHFAYIYNVFGDCKDWEEEE